MIMEHYGDVLYKLGRKEESLQYWKKAAGLGKGSEWLGKRYRMVFYMNDPCIATAP